MAKEIKTQIRIKADITKVWDVLVDFDSYPNWNPFIKSLTGDFEEGKQLKVLIQPPGQKAMKFTPEIKSLLPGKKFEWLGKLIFPGLFDGRHSFELIDNGDGTTTFHHNELFKGLLIGLLNIEKTTQGFQLMNQRLKELCELN